MGDPQHTKANLDWDVTKSSGVVSTWEKVIVVLLQDIRHELRVIRRNTAVLSCQNAIEIPSILRSIRKNTTKRRVRRVQRAEK